MKIFIFVLYANTTFEQIIAVDKLKILASNATNV